HQTDDFERTQRQQDVIMAVRKKALGSLGSLLGQAPDLWNKLNAAILTDLSFDQWVGLGWYAKDITPESIKRGTVTNQYIQPIQYQGDTALTVNRNEIGKLMAQLFGSDYSR